MGYIDFENEHWHLKRITSASKRRGLAPETKLGLASPLTTLRAMIIKCMKVGHIS